MFEKQLFKPAARGLCCSLSSSASAASLTAWALIPCASPPLSAGLGGELERLHVSELGVSSFKRENGGGGGVVLGIRGEKGTDLRRWRSQHCAKTSEVHK